MHGKDDKFGRNEGKNHLDSLCLNGSIILKWVLRTQRGSEPCIYLTHDWEYWWALVNMEINLWVP
jgi:hypothetical protein